MHPVVCTQLVTCNELEFFYCRLLMRCLKVASASIVLNQRGVAAGCQCYAKAAPHPRERRGCAPPIAGGNIPGFGWLWLLACLQADCCMHAVLVMTAPSYGVMQEFSELQKKRKFYDSLLSRVAELGFAEPTPIQRQVIPLLMARREVMAVAPTGVT